ncbi:IS110 family transposase [Burkholderia cenocepacia]|uniref:IS110 family transposase n=1 Tax=Burkholderia cenocepacia TaxID=95486 RepID=UPI002857AC6B|nr:IS110 family transposase [Burkholderia cenocepacia]MDR8038778.1 IS110 family transposase [Burkholderia cenocepacia]
MNSVTLGIDLGKRWFHVVGCDAAGKVVLREKLGRHQLLQLMAQHPPSLVGIETCCGSQYLARKFQGFGHDVKLLPAQYVKPFVKSQKNDFNDAQAIAEAVRLPTMRFVPLKSEEQMDVQALHRCRERMLQQRLALTNQIRGLLLDRGIEIAQGFYALRTVLPSLLEKEDSGLTPMMRDLGRMLLDMWNRTEATIEQMNDRLKCLARESDLCRRLQTIPGVGILLSTAIVSAAGNASTFKRARDLAAWVGLVPQQHTTGGKLRLLGITKRGNSYLRRLFVQGARALWVWKDKHPNDPIQRWLLQLAERRHAHVAVCALANKLVRIAWAVMRSGAEFNLHYRT